MRLVCISDTHNTHKKLIIPECDVLIHCGDYSSKGHIWEIRDFYKWLDKQSAKHIISIQGNHELGWEQNPALMTDEARKECPRIILLNDSSTMISGIKFYGTPVQPYFLDWAYNRAETDAEILHYGVPSIKPHFEAIPNDTDVLITHGPPLGILDEVKGREGQHLGSSSLLEAVKRVKPDIHVFGHIHTGHGEKHQDGTSFYNVAICDERNYPSQSVRVIEYIK